MRPGKLSLDPFTEGDRWDGIPNLSITSNGTTPESPIQSVTMRFKRAGEVPSTPVELSSAEAGEIEIVSAANWEITVPPQEVSGLTRGKWIWRMRIIAQDGSKRTYLADEIEILETV